MFLNMLYLLAITYRVRIGAKLRLGLIGKNGEIPSLSRNCKSERLTFIMPLSFDGKVCVGSFEDKPGDLPVPSIHQIPTWK